MLLLVRGILISHHFGTFEVVSEDDVDDDDEGGESEPIILILLLPLSDRSKRLNIFNAFCDDKSVVEVTSS